jgi:hypothetical protein
MAYAAVSDVQALMAKFTIDANSKPTTTQVTSMINDISGEIDAVLAGRGLTVPVTTPTYFVDALTMLNTYGAAVLVAQAMLPDRAGAAEASSAIYTVWDQRYRTGMAALRDGEGIPPTAPASGRIQPSTYFTRNPDSEEDLGDIAEPTFTRSQVF